MTMRRPQFSLKTLLWLMAVVGAFLGGVVMGQRIGKEAERAYWLDVIREL
ncbi:MAG TPA: hypothetical protein VNH11_13755 [Pirellulales bacterium]|nr:hypothetical protein [Pirellulales bacterium]